MNRYIPLKISVQNCPAIAEPEPESIIYSRNQSFQICDRCRLCRTTKKHEMERLMNPTCGCFVRLAGSRADQEYECRRGITFRLTNPGLITPMLVRATSRCFAWHDDLDTRFGIAEKFRAGQVHG